jgi:hypothetical protein
MYSRICSDILTVLFIFMTLILRLILCIRNESEAVGIELLDIEGWETERSPAQPELFGKELKSEIRKAASTG